MMIKRSKAQWQALFKQHKASGLSAAKFCREHSLCPKYFSLRKKQLGVKPAFVQVKPNNLASTAPTHRIVSKQLPTDKPDQVRIRLIEFDVPLAGLSETIASLWSQH